MLITDKFQPFTGVASIVWPDHVPFRATCITTKGHRLTDKITNFNQLDEYEDEELVAIKIFDIIDSEKITVRNLLAEYAPQASVKGLSEKQILAGALDSHPIYKVVEALHRDFDLVKAVEPRPCVLPNRLARRLTASEQKQANDWYYNQDGGDKSYELGKLSLERKLGNNLLAIRTYGFSGRRVVIPTGHSIAYTTAKRVYQEVTTYNSLHNMNRRVTAGENMGKRVTTRKFTIHFHKLNKTIEIGCQFIPFRALKELAEREGWNQKPDWNNYA